MKGVKILDKDMTVDLESEKYFLNHLLKSIIFLKRRFGIKLEMVGELNHELLEALNLDYDYEHVLAGYYANIGLLAIENIIEKNEHVCEKDREIIKQHVYFSSKFTEDRGLLKASEIIKLHHEKPNGKGYYRVVNENIYSCIINIADEYIGLISESKTRPALICEVAINQVFKEYRFNNIIKPKQLKIIESVLYNYYMKLKS